MSPVLDTRKLQGSNKVIGIGRVEVVVLEKYNHVPGFNKLLQSLCTFSFKGLHIHVISERGNVIEDGKSCCTFLNELPARKAHFERSICEELSKVEAAEPMISGLPESIWLLPDRLAYDRRDELRVRR